MYIHAEKKIWWGQTSSDPMNVMLAFMYMYMYMYTHYTVPAAYMLTWDFDKLVL